MNRRQRKKLRVGEFRETILFAKVEFQIDPTHRDEELDAFLEELEREGMLCGGGFGNPIEVTVQLCTCTALQGAGSWSVRALRQMQRRRCRSRMTELHAAKVRRLLEKHLGPVKRVVKWELEDANWGPAGYPERWDWDWEEEDA